MLNEELMKKARAAKSPEELIKLGAEEGLTLGKENAERYFESMHKSGEVTDEELSSAVGGCGGYSASIYRPCPTCGSNVPMGDFLCVQVFEYNEEPFYDSFPTGICPKCKSRYAYCQSVEKCFPVSGSVGNLSMYPTVKLHLKHY